MTHYTRTVLCIAGFDTSGNAGILADSRTVNSLGLFCSGIITVLTDQTRERFYSSSPVDPGLIKEQLEHLLRGENIHSIKIGMLYSSGIIKTLADILKQYKPQNIVLDPVIMSSSGGELIEPESIDLLVEELIPLVNIITPNIPEAEKLTGMKIDTVDRMIDAGMQISDLGSMSVMVKGGHLNKNSTDILVTGNEQAKISGEFIPGPEIRGTGCVLSSAIASYLAMGFDTKEAVILSKRFLENARREPVYDEAGNTYLDMSQAGSD